MSDQSIIVRGNGTIFLGGPPLVKAATGEVVSAQDLGGADVHSRLSGVTDYTAESEAEACEIARDIVKYLNLNPEPLSLGRMEGEDPLYDCSELAGILPRDAKRSFDVREVIARIVDGSRFLEFKKEFGATMVTGFASLFGIPIGIVANNGILFSESTLKAVHFIEECSQRKLPLVFLQNITGFMVGSEYEGQGIAKHGAKLVTARLHHALSQAHAHPRRQLRRRQLWNGRSRVLAAVSYMLPNSRISVMGGMQAATVLSTVKREGIERKGRVGRRNSAVGGKWSAEEEEAFKKPILEKYEREGSYLYSTARLWDDGVICYKDTRKVLGLSLYSCLQQGEIEDTTFGLFRMFPVSHNKQTID